MEVYERLSGARMHTAMYKPFSLNVDLFFNQLVSDVVFLLQRGSRVISGAFLGLLSNKALKSRLSGVGFFSTNKLNQYSISGIIARSSGVVIDARLGIGANYYSGYNLLSFRTFLGKKGDCYDRFLTRTKEILESYRLITQALSLLTSTKIKIQLKKRAKFTSMEGVISHFKKTMSPISNVRG